MFMNKFSFVHTHFSHQHFPPTILHFPIYFRQQNFILFVCLCKVLELAVGGLMAVSVGISDRQQVTGDMQHMTHNTRLGLYIYF